MKIVGGKPADEREIDVNMTAYVAVGSGTTGWCAATSRSCASTGRWCARRWGWVVAQQVPWGGLNYTPPGTTACSPATRASTSRCAPASRSPTCRRPQPGAGAGRRPAGHAVRGAPRPLRGQVDLLDGLVLPGARRAVRGQAAFDLLQTRWDEFVVPGMGIHCVDTNPWVTGAETCELAMAVDMLGRPPAGASLVADMQFLREDDGPLLDRWVYGDQSSPRSRATSTGRSSTRRTPRPR